MKLALAAIGGALGASACCIGPVMFSLLGAGFTAYFVGRACHRNATSSLVGMLGHWSSLVGAILISVVTAYLGFHAMMWISLRKSLPSTDARYLLAIGASLAIIGISAWTLLWWRRREQARIGD